MLKRKHKPPRIKMAVALYALPECFETSDQVHEFLCARFNPVRRDYANKTWWSIVGDPPMDVIVGSHWMDVLQRISVQIDFTPAEVKLAQAREVVQAFEAIGAKPFNNAFEWIEAIVLGQEVPEIVMYIAIQHCAKCDCRYVNAESCPQCGRRGVKSHIPLVEYPSSPPPPG